MYEYMYAFRNRLQSSSLPIYQFTIFCSPCKVWFVLAGSWLMRSKRIVTVASRRAPDMSCFKHVPVPTRDIPTRTCIPSCIPCLGRPMSRVAIGRVVHSARQVYEYEGDDSME